MVLYNVASLGIALLSISAVSQASSALWRPHIMNGVEATPGELPYQVGIIIDREGICGGALISNLWVLTAAHCVDGKSLFTVNLGAHNVELPKEPGRVIVNTRLAFPHEYFNRFSMDNDVALIKLPQPTSFNERVQPIQLAPRSLITKDFTGHEMRISGWGKTSHIGGPSSTLRYADITMISNEECKKTYGDIITDKLICGFGPRNRNGCNGDSGGPLVLKSEGKNVHFGVLSFVNKRGCASGKPTGFDRTVYFLDWIANKTGITVVN